VVERESIVCLRGIWKTYAVGDQEVHALAGVDLDIRRGEYVAIMGPSGSGKSTMLNLLGCLDRPTDGTYHLGEEEVSGMNDGELSDLRNRRIGFVFQSFNLIPWLTLEQNIEVPLFYGGMSHGRRRPISEELAHRVGLGNRLGHRPNELSGGQKQRVAIARSLANDPLVLLADEPTGNLDSGTTREILDLFDELHQRGRTIIMVTHEEDVAKRTQRILRMRDGVVVDDSPTPASQPCEA
jgi:putative ABC transport system ATP-binding protein